MSLLEVSKLAKHFPSRRKGGRVYALNDVTFNLEQGQTLGVVGESGCGKSTLARTVLHLLTPTSGRVVFEGAELADLGASALRRKRRDMQIVFQDPFASLDPRFTVDRLLTEPLAIHGLHNAAERAHHVTELLETVGLTADSRHRYPHEFSGGQRQRVSIARALILRPKLIIADEPVSALDVSIQSQILNLLVAMRKQFRLTYIVISHDLAVVHHISDRVAVMYLGRIVEMADSDALFANPKHPYTRNLIDAVPQASATKRRHQRVLQGEPPDPENPPAGCPFHPRCPEAMDICQMTPPPLIDVSSGGENSHETRCHLFS